MRITGKYMMKWLDDKLNELKMGHWKSVRIVNFNPNGDQVEGGAAIFGILITDGTDTATISCCYYMKQLEQCLIGGHRLYLKDKGRFGLFCDTEIDVRK